MLSNYVTREYLDIMINLFSAAPLYRHPLTGEKIDYDLRLGQGKFHSLFIYSLMLRNNREFMEDDRGIPITDIFSNNTSSRWKRFVKYYILNYLAESNERVASVELLSEQLYNNFNIGKDDVRSAITALCRKQCIALDTPNHIEAESHEAALEKPSTMLMVSPRGLFHLNLSSELEYYEILAFGRLLRMRRDLRSLDRTSMAERGENLWSFLAEMVKEENECLNNKKPASWAWKDTCYPKLVEEFKKIFEHHAALNR